MCNGRSIVLLQEKTANGRGQDSKIADVSNGWSLTLCICIYKFMQIWSCKHQTVMTQGLCGMLRSLTSSNNGSNFVCGHHILKQNSKTFETQGKHAFCFKYFFILFQDLMPGKKIAILYNKLLEKQKFWLKVDKIQVVQVAKTKYQQ